MTPAIVLVALVVIVFMAIALHALISMLRNREEKIGRLSNQLRGERNASSRIRSKMHELEGYLSQDIENLEKELGNCAMPGHHRQRLERLLQISADRVRSDSGAPVRQDSPTGGDNSDKIRLQRDRSGLS